MLTIYLLISIVVLVVVKYFHDFSSRLAQLGNSCHGQTYTLWSYLRDKYRSFSHCQQLICEGYSQFARTSTPFVVPTLLNGPTVVLPPSLAQELYNALDTELDFQQAVINDGLQANYLFPGVSDVRFHASVFRRQLANSAIQARASSILEEAEEALHTLWPLTSEKDGLSGAWTEVNVYTSVMTIAAQIAMREFVGLRLCRDSQFLKTLVGYFASVRLSAGLLNQCPGIFRWAMSKIILIPLRRKRADLAKKLTPIIQSEKSYLNNERSKGNPQREISLLYWIIVAAREQSDPNCYSAEQIVDRFLMTSFVAAHTTSIVLYAAIFRLTESSSMFEMLRSEALGVFGNIHRGDSQTGLRIADLQTTNSFIYECLRNSHQNLLILRRTVSSKGGYRFGNGYWVSQGAVVALPGYEMHRDEVDYDRGREFDPSRWLDGCKKSGGDGKTYEVGAGTDPKALGSHFLAFGNGKHICPGRFWAVTALKCIVASLALRYEIRLKETDPMGPGRWIGENVMPDERAVILVFCLF